MDEPHHTIQAQLFTRALWVLLTQQHLKWTLTRFVHFRILGSHKKKESKHYTRGDKTNDSQKSHLNELEELELGIRRGWSNSGLVWNLNQTTNRMIEENPTLTWSHCNHFGNYVRHREPVLMGKGEKRQGKYRWKIFPAASVWSKCLCTSRFSGNLDLPLLFPHGRR